MPKSSNRLTARERCALSASAAALLLVGSMTQCAALDANQLLRETLWIASSLLTLLSVAILLEDTWCDRWRTPCVVSFPNPR